jgi:hypothetical protein
VNYTKPEIAVLSSAIRAIETSQLVKPSNIQVDREGTQYPLTANAYEADE